MQARPWAACGRRCPQVRARLQAHRQAGPDGDGDGSQVARRDARAAQRGSDRAVHCSRMRLPSQAGHHAAEGRVHVHLRRQRLPRAGRCADAGLALVPCRLPGLPKLLPCRRWCQQVCAPVERAWPRMAPSLARTTATPVSSQLLSMPSTSVSLAVAKPARRPQLSCADAAWTAEGRPETPRHVCLCSTTDSLPCAWTAA
jgi:hypothetical protein